MCYEKPGPRCSGHTRTNLIKAKEAVVAAEKDLAEKQNAVTVAQSNEARIALHQSTSALKAAKSKLADAIKKYEVSKTNRAIAMYAYRQAKKEYFTSPEGIKKNRTASVNPALTEEQRALAARLAHSGQTARDKQIEAYKIAQAKKEANGKVVSVPESYTERMTMLMHASTTGEQIAAVASDSNETIRQMAAKHQNADDATLIKLSTDSSPYVVSTVTNNEHAPFGALKNSVVHSGVQIRRYSVDHAAWQAKTYLQPEDASLANKKYSDLEPEVWSATPERLAVLSTYRETGLVRLVAAKPDTPKHVLEKLVMHPDPGVRNDVVGNPAWMAK